MQTASVLALNVLARRVGRAHAIHWSAIERPGGATAHIRTRLGLTRYSLDFS